MSKKKLNVRHITIDKRSLQRLEPIDPKDCQLKTLYFHIPGWGRYKASDLYNVRCKSWFDKVALQEWFDWHKFAPIFHVR